MPTACTLSSPAREATTLSECQSTRSTPTHPHAAVLHGLSSLRALGLHKYQVSPAGGLLHAARQGTACQLGSMHFRSQRCRPPTCTAPPNGGTPALQPCRRLCSPLTCWCPLPWLQEVALAALPPGVAAALHRLEVTPRPEAMRCQLEVQLPAGARLEALMVHGSFRRVLSTAAAPLVIINTVALAR